MSPLLLALALFAAGPAEERGEVDLVVDGTSYTKRHVLRYPAAAAWNGKLVVAAHGGRGGESYSRDGRVLGTDETSLDDVIGEEALAEGYAYASIDRDGIGGTREGLRLTRAFTEKMESRLAELLRRKPERTYLFGLSMGGGIARYASEERPPGYDGVVLIAGAHGDAAARLERQIRMALAWPAVDPKRVAEPAPAALAAYAKAVGTPVEAKAFWPYMGSSASVERVIETLAGYGLEGLDAADLENFRVSDHPALERKLLEEDTTGRPQVPTIEIVGTFDDFVGPEILAYRKKVEAAGLAERHRLYRVHGAWHISRDDDAITSFQFLGSRMGLSPDSVDAMATGATYLPTVHEALSLIDAWVTEGEAPPPGRDLDEGEPIAP